MFFDNFFSDLKKQMEEDYVFDETIGTNFSGCFPEHDEDFDDDDDGDDY